MGVHSPVSEFPTPIPKRSSPRRAAFLPSPLRSLFRTQISTPSLGHAHSLLSPTTIFEGSPSTYGETGSIRELSLPVIANLSSPAASIVQESLMEAPARFPADSSLPGLHFNPHLSITPFDFTYDRYSENGSALQANDISRGLYPPVIAKETLFSVSSPSVLCRSPLSTTSFEGTPYGHSDNGSGLQANDVSREFSLPVIANPSSQTASTTQESLVEASPLSSNSSPPRRHHFPPSTTFFEGPPYGHGENGSALQANDVSREISLPFIANPPSQAASISQESLVEASPLPSNSSPPRRRHHFPPSTTFFEGSPYGHGENGSTMQASNVSREISLPFIANPPSPAASISQESLVEASPLPSDSSPPRSHHFPASTTFFKGTPFGYSKNGSALQVTDVPRGSSPPVDANPSLPAASIVPESLMEESGQVPLDSSPPPSPFLATPSEPSREDTTQLADDVVRDHYPFTNNLHNASSADVQWDVTGFISEERPIERLERKPSSHRRDTMFIKDLLRLRRRRAGLE